MARNPDATLKKTVDNALFASPQVPTTNNANPQSINTITGERYKFSVLDGQLSRANLPGYFYTFFESPRGLNFGGYFGGSSNGLDFGQRNAFPSSAFHGETLGSNEVVQRERVGSTAIPETIVARQLAGVKSTTERRKKPRYIAAMFR